MKEREGEGGGETEGKRERNVKGKGKVASWLLGMDAPVWQSVQF